VGDDDRCTMQPDGLAEEFPHPYDAGVEAADVNGGRVQVVDVRSQPYSRHVPHCNRETLAHILREQGFTRPSMSCWRWPGNDGCR
jgi:hypothetical protein